MKRGGFLKRKTPLVTRTPLKAKTGLSRGTGFKRKAPVKKAKRGNFSELARAYGLDEGAVKRGPKGLRYRSPVEKGICWYWFARYVRARDWTGYGRCISCDKRKTYEQLQAGHFVPAGDCGTTLLMDERNVNGECNDCNAFDAMHLRGYERNLDIRYGSGTGETLVARKYERGHKEPSRAEYLLAAQAYRSHWEELMQWEIEILTEPDGV